MGHSFSFLILKMVTLNTFNSRILEMLTSVDKRLEDQSVRIARLNQQVEQLQRQTGGGGGSFGDSFFKQSNIITIAIVLFAILLNSVLTAVINRKNYSPHQQ